MCSDSNPYIFLTGNLASKNSKIFYNITQGNKNSLSTFLPIAHAIMKDDFGPHSPGYVVYCQRMLRHTKPSSKSAKWYIYIYWIVNFKLYIYIFMHLVMRDFQLVLIKKKLKLTCNRNSSIVVY